MERLTEKSKVLDEAIARERQLAKEQRSHIGTWDDEYSKKCEVYAEEHEQRAEWLEELKAYQQQHISLCEKHEVNTVEDLYVKAITDFVNRLSEYLCMENATKYGNKDAEQQRNSYDTLMKYEIADAVYDVAEQLKAGGKNED